MKKSTKIMLMVAGGLALAVGGYYAYNKFVKKEDGEASKKSDEDAAAPTAAPTKPKIKLSENFDPTPKSFSLPKA